MEQPFEETDENTERQAEGFGWAHDKRRLPEKLAIANFLNSDNSIFTTKGTLRLVEKALSEDLSKVRAARIVEEKQEMDKDTIEKVEKYSSDLMSAWDKIVTARSGHKVTAVGFPAGVIFYFENTPEKGHTHSVAGEFPDIYSALNVIERNAKLERVPSIKEIFDKVAKEKTWPFKEVQVYEIELNGMYFIKAKDQLSDSATDDVKSYWEQYKKSFNL